MKTSLVSIYDRFIHNFNGRYYVCVWDSERDEMRALAPKNVGGWHVSRGYSEDSANHVSSRIKFFTNLESARIAAQRKYGFLIA